MLTAAAIDEITIAGGFWKDASTLKLTRTPVLAPKRRVLLKTSVTLVIVTSEFLIEELIESATACRNDLRAALLPKSDDETPAINYWK